MSQNKFLEGCRDSGHRRHYCKGDGRVLPHSADQLGRRGRRSYYSSVYPIYTFFDFVDGGHSGCGLPHGFRNVLRSATTAARIKSFIRRSGSQPDGLRDLCDRLFRRRLHREPCAQKWGTMMALQAIAPALFIVPVMSAYRGYFFRADRI